MTRWFNTGGPCLAREHYMIPPERRAREALALLEQGRWFSLVSGRQTGKTTVLQSLARTVTRAGSARAFWVDLESARAEPELASAMRTILDCLADALRHEGAASLAPEAVQVNEWLSTPATALEHYVSAVCAASDRPVVLLLDEADVITGRGMVSFLTQLRALYLARERRPAPHCVVLSGVRAVRDYVVDDMRGHVAWLGTASPFNVTVENVGLAAFTEAEVAELCAQHTAETTQRFEADALARVYALSRGHPWLVNALCDQCTRRDVPDRTVAVTATHVEAAKETLILERRTHIDSLVARLREERVRRVLDPMIAGSSPPDDLLDDDVAYVVGLGLIRLEGGVWQPSNAIYREVIPRALTYMKQTSLPQKTAWCVGADGLLDAPKLMAGWQTFWRKDGHLAAEGFFYKESGPHLMLMAFLQRIVNGGGRVEREYALGKGALDLLLLWRVGEAEQRVAIEVKLRRATETEDEAVAQVEGYLDTLGMREGWLVIFDLRSTTPWSERIFTREHTAAGFTVRVVGC